MKRVQSVCVYCGSRFGNDPAYAETAERLGRLLAKRGLRLVFGAGGLGLMGTVARAALEAGGEVVGIIPTHLQRTEVALPDLTETIITGTMHERKMLMFERSDAFVTLPGGIGTLDEMVEMISWRQLMLHDKPLALVDVNGYWQPFIAMLEAVIAAGFAPESLRDFYAVVPDVDDVPEVLEGLKEKLVSL